MHKRQGAPQKCPKTSSLRPEAPFSYLLYLRLNPSKDYLSSEITDFNTIPKFSLKYIKIKKYFYLFYRRENSQIVLKSGISELTFAIYLS